MEAIQGQRQLFQDTVTFDDDTADLDSPLAETQVEKLGSYTQVLGDSLENAKHELPSQVIPDSEDEEIHGDQLENAADGVSDVETGIRIKGNGVAGLQMRQPSPRFQWLKDIAEAFVSDGSAGEDKGAGLFSMILSSKSLALLSLAFYLFISVDICFDSINEFRPILYMLMR